MSRNKIAASWSFISSASLLVVLVSAPTSFAALDQTQTEGAPAPTHDAVNLLNDNLVKPLLETMTYASTDLPGIHQGEKNAQSTHQNEVASILNSFKASAYGGKTDEDAGVDTTINAKGTPTTANGIVNYAAGTVVASMTTYFQAHGIQLNVKSQKVVLELLRMQDATSSAQSFISAITNQFSEYFLTIYIRELTKLQERLLDLTPGNPNLVPPSLGSKIGTLLNSRNKSQQTRDEQIAILSKFVDPSMRKDLVKEIRQETEEVLMASIQNKDGPSLNWENMENLFPVPDSPETAFTQASKSPTIILAEINEMTAKNNWYLNLASIGPSFTLSFTRNDNNQLAYPVGVTTPTDKKAIDNVWAGGFTLSIGGGILNTMKAASLAEEASKYGEQDAKSNLHSALEGYYADLSASESSLRINAHNIKMTMPKLQQEVDSINSVDRTKIQEALQNYSELENAVTSFNLAFNAQLTARLQILVATGQLLNQLQGTQN